MRHARFASNPTRIALPARISGLLIALTVLLSLSLTACGLSEVGPELGKLKEFNDSKVVNGDTGTCKLANCQAQDRCITWGCSKKGCQQTGIVVCDDGIACTKDACDQTTGCNSLYDGIACEDANVCTTDSCDKKTGCVYLPRDASCTGGRVCSNGVCS